jgi:hypothetical protein
MRRNNAFQFPTNRDRDAFGEAIKRSELSYAKGEFWRLEFIGNPVDAECKSCRCGHANVRIVFNYGEYSGFGSDDYCLSCFYGAVRSWYENMMDDMKEQYKDYRSQQRQA